MEGEFIEIFHKDDFTRWLAKNHDKKTKVGLILHKKHTGKGSPSHRELMEEAICFGWIDTIIKRVDSDRYVRFFSKRSKNSKWSYNTLGYAKNLVREKRMMPSGMKFYKEGLRKLPHDHGLPKNLPMPADLKAALAKNKLTKRNFQDLPRSMKRTYFRWILRGKMPETRKKRVLSILEMMRRGQERKRTSWRVNK